MVEGMSVNKWCLLAVALAVSSVFWAAHAPCDVPLALQLLPIALCARWGGLAPGLAATAATGASANLWLVDRHLGDPADVARLTALVVAGATITIGCEVFTRMRRPILGRI
jgi:hypothetical protein